MTPDLRSNDELVRKDEAARLAAKRVFDRPLVLEAGAGTGKTATLVARIVCWALGPGWRAAADAIGEGAPSAGAPEPEQIGARVLKRIVAITFTEAAAAEMAARVGQALACLERGELPLAVTEDDFDSDTGTDERSERARALRANLERLQVSTIHAFCRRLLAEHPLEAGVAQGFDIDADESRLEGAVRDVLEEILREAWREQGSEDVIELAAAGHGPTEIETAALELLRQGARATDFERDPLAPPELATRVGTLHGRIQAMDDAGVAQLCNVRGALSQAAAAAVLASVDATRSADVQSEAAFESLRATLREIWDEGNVLTRLKDWSRGKLNKSESEVAGDSLVDAAAATYPLLVTLLNADIKLLTTGRLLMGRLLAGVERALRQAGVATFADLLRGARALLDDHPGVARRVRAGIGLLLVDEFQDTDDEQCGILKALTIEGAEGPSLFLVGDPKQSIYGWRNANLAAYEAFVGAALAQGGERHALARNFRSRPAILREVRAAIEPVMEQVAGIQPHFEPLLPHREPASSAAPSVEYWVSWTRHDESGRVAPPAKERNRLATYELEARAVARDAARLATEGVPWNEMALLFRSMGDVEVYIQALREEGVPYAVQRDRGYYRRREVIDAAALIRCVLDPNDQVALVTFLRSPSVGVPDAALALLWAVDFPSRVARIAHIDTEGLAQLREDLRTVAARLPLEIPGMAELAGWDANLMQTLTALAQLRHAFEHEPADRFVERIRCSMLPEATEAGRYLGAFRLANLQRFFRQFLRTLEEQRGDTQAVLRMLRTHVGGMRDAVEARPPDAAEDAVQVLTFHGAKGLEFGHVYLVQLHREPPNDRSAPNDFERIGDSAEYVLFGAPTLGFEEVRARRRQVEEAERVRLLYVAATRAAERLVLVGQWPAKRERKDWRGCRRLIDLLESRAGATEALAVLATRAQEEDATVHVDELGASWSLPALSDRGARGARPAEVPALLVTKDVAAQSRALCDARTAARTHQTRQIGSAASDDLSHERHEALGARERTGPAPVTRDVARTAGTVVHRALEMFDLAADPADEWKRQLASLPAYAEVLVEPSGVAAVVEHGRETLARLRESPLFDRFVALRDQIVARELPVLAPVDADADADENDEGPVGFVSGAIDMLYRDPETAELVVVDFKSDRAQDEAALAELVSAYRGQGKAYVEVIQNALALSAPPRFELWFLHAGTTVAVDL